MNAKDTARKLLDTIQYATIATFGSDGEPWNTPVFCAHDGYTIYWSSHPDAVHSRNIATTHNAFIAIYNSKVQEEATPLRAWINDADQDADGDFIKDYRVELELK